MFSDCSWLGSKWYHGMPGPVEPVHLIQFWTTLIGLNSLMLDTWPWSTQNHGSCSACLLPSVPFSYFFSNTSDKISSSSSSELLSTCEMSFVCENKTLWSGYKMPLTQQGHELDTWSLSGNAVLGACGPSMTWDVAGESRSLGGEPWRWHWSPVLACVVDFLVSPSSKELPSLFPVAEEWVHYACLPR